MGALGFIDGRIVDLKELVVAMEDRGYQFGDGVYEYTKVYNGKCFSLKPHIDRCIGHCASCGFLRCLLLPRWKKFIIG